MASPHPLPPSSFRLIPLTRCPGTATQIPIAVPEKNDPCLSYVVAYGWFRLRRRPDPVPDLPSIRGKESCASCGAYLFIFLSCEIDRESRERESRRPTKEMVSPFNGY